MQYSHLLITGDFNYPKIDWTTWSTDSDNLLDMNNQFIEAMRDSFLFQHVSLPTRARLNNSPNLLDLVLTNEEGMISNLEIHSPLGKSDHGIIYFDFQCYINL